MSEIKNTTHTPGPWSYIDEREGTPNAFRIASAKGTDAVAYVVGYRDPEGNDEETEANAARIVDCVNACTGIADPSVVPDLLAACKAAWTYLEEHVSEGNPCPDDETTGKVEAALGAAIHKATGGLQGIEGESATESEAYDDGWADGENAMLEDLGLPDRKAAQETMRLVRETLGDIVANSSGAVYVRASNALALLGAK